MNFCNGRREQRWKDKGIVFEIEKVLSSLGKEKGYMGAEIWE